MKVTQLQSDLNASLKAGNAVRVSTLRFLLSAIRNTAIAKYGAKWDSSLTEDDISETVKRQVKTHKESIEAFGKAGRTELVDKERAELSVLEEFAPKELSDEQLKVILVPVAASGEKNFGLLMKEAMALVNGKADGGRVAACLKQLLQQ